jgi:hypothetical protein
MTSPLKKRHLKTRHVTHADGRAGASHRLAKVKTERGVSISGQGHARKGGPDRQIAKRPWSKPE